MITLRLWGKVAFFLAVLSATVAARGGEPAEVPLTVWEQGGATRVADIATGGIPLPEGAVAEPAAELRVLDSAGKALPAQFLALDRWWVTPNKSVRWCLVSFPASVKAGAKAKYTLKLAAKGSPPPPATTLKVSEEADAVTVVTGPLKLRISKKGFNLFDGVWLDAGGDGKFDEGEQIVAPSPQGGAVLTVGDWPGEKLKEGDKYFSSGGAPKKVVIEEKGPVRACVYVQGAHLPRGAGFAEGVYDYKVRIYAYAGQPYVRVFYTLANSRLSRVLRAWPLKSLNLVTGLQGGAKYARFLDRGGRPVDAALGSTVSLLQDVDDSKKEGPAPSYVIRQGSKELAKGEWAPGVLDVSGDRFGVTVGVKDFPRMCPKGLSADAKGLKVELFPAGAGKTYYITPGRKRTHEMVYLFHAGKGSERHLKLARALAAQELRPVAPAKWYQRSRAWFGGMSIVDAEECPHSCSSALKKTGRWAAWYCFGWFGRDWNLGGGHPHQFSQGLSYILSGGKLERLAEAEAMARWISDMGLGTVMDLPAGYTALDPKHLADKHLHDFFVFMGGLGFDSPGRFKRCGTDLSYRTYPGGPKVESGGPYEMIRIRVNPAHLGMVGMHEFYRLTGDRSVLEGMDAVATMARSAMRVYISLGSRRMFVEKDNPDDPNYKMQTRYCGWPLYEIADMYARTGNPIYAREAEFIVKGLRNRARTSPIGLIAKPAAPPGSGYACEYLDRNKCAAQCEGILQLGIVGHGLGLYYRETGDEEALDALLALTDQLTHVSMARTPEGKMKGWHYSWSDYWVKGRTKPMKRIFCGWGSSAVRGYRPLSAAHDATGREDYRAVSSAVHEACKGRRLGSIVGLEGQGAFYPHQCPKKDGTAPMAVKDLKGEPLGNAAVKLTWTAPGGDGDKGRAARYQVKYSTDPIVERVKGWPDRTPPLPQTEKEWEAKAAAFMARNGRPFTLAVNCKGEAQPGPAGQKESHVVKNLKPGKYHFALKSYDQAHNQSGLSNVVTLEVR